MTPYEQAVLAVVTKSSGPFTDKVFSEISLGLTEHVDEAMTDAGLAADHPLTSLLPPALLATTMKMLAAKMDEAADLWRIVYKDELRRHEADAVR